MTRALLVVALIATLPTASGQTTGAPTHRVIASRLNVRDGPGMERDVVGQLARGAPVRVVATHGAWSRLPGDAPRWVASRYLERLPVVGVADVLSPDPDGAAPVPPAPPAAPPPAVAEARARLARATDWLYQLQRLDPAAVRASRFDLLVTDPTRDGTDDTRWARSMVQSLRDGGRVCLAYLSVGEAEDYRGYWRAAWRTSPPSWLGPENPDWKGNFRVRFWDPAWQAVLLADDGPLARIVDAGWDGAYLDIVDGFEFWVDRGEFDLEEGMRRMAAFVARVAAFARARRPEFLIVPQNAPGLAVRPDVLSTIDALAIEDTFYDGDQAQPAATTREVLAHVRAVRAAGKPVLAVDYCRAPGRVDRFYELARSEGLVPYATVRDLDRLVVNPGHEP